MKHTADRSRMSQFVAAEMSYFGSKYAMPFIAGSTALVSIVALLFSLFFNISQSGGAQNLVYLVLSIVAAAAFIIVYIISRMRFSREGLQYDNVLIFTAECFLICTMAGFVFLRTSWMWRLIEISPGQFNRYLRNVITAGLIVPLAVAALYFVFTFILTDTPLPYLGWVYKVYTFVPASVLALVFIGTRASNESNALGVVTVTTALYISLTMGFTAHLVCKLIMFRYLEGTPARYETFIKVKHAAREVVVPSRAAAVESFTPDFTPDLEPETIRDKVAAGADRVIAAVEEAAAHESDRLKGEATGETKPSGIAGFLRGLAGKNKNKRAETAAPRDDELDYAADLFADDIATDELGTDVELAATEAAADAAAEAERERVEAETAQAAAEAERLELEQRAAEAEELARIEAEAAELERTQREKELADELERERAEEERKAALERERAAAPAVEREAAAVELEPDAEDGERQLVQSGAFSRMRNSIKGLISELNTPLEGLYLETRGGETDKPGQKEENTVNIGDDGEFVIGTGITERAPRLDTAPAEPESADKEQAENSGERQRVGQFFESRRSRVKDVTEADLTPDYAAPAKSKGTRLSLWARLLLWLGITKPETETPLVTGDEDISDAVSSLVEPAKTAVDPAALERLRAMAAEKERLEGRAQPEAAAEPRKATGVDSALERLRAMAAEKERLEGRAAETADETGETAPAQLALERLRAMAAEKERLESVAQPEAPSEPPTEFASAEPADEPEDANRQDTKTAAEQPKTSALERLAAMAKKRTGRDILGESGYYDAEPAAESAPSGDSALARLTALAEEKARSDSASADEESSQDSQARQTVAVETAVETEDIVEQLDDEPESEEIQATASEPEDEPLEEVMDDDFAALRDYGVAPHGDSGDPEPEQPAGESRQSDEPDEQQMGESDDEDGEPEVEQPAGDSRQSDEPDERQMGETDGEDGEEQAKREPIRAQVVRRSVVKPHSPQRRKPPRRNK